MNINQAIITVCEAYTLNVVERIIQINKFSVIIKNTIAQNKLIDKQKRTK